MARGHAALNQTPLMQRRRRAGACLLADAAVVRGEVVAREAEGAAPDLGVEVHGGVRVEDGAAGLAGHRLIGDHLHARKPLVGMHEVGYLHYCCNSNPCSILH
jgi:hypothetical protein